MKDSRRHNGFTMIEVLVAIGILTVGSLGLLSMHQTILRANREARGMNHALTVMDTWLGRLDRDALSWTTKGNVPDTTSAYTNTEYVKLVTSFAPRAWFTPSPSEPTESYAFDAFGEDTSASTSNVRPIRYCTNIQLSWVVAGASMRADIRVYWMREGRGANAANANWLAGGDFTTSDCDAGDANNWLAPASTAPNLNVIYGSTVIRWTGAS